jgi:hypothetical protein
VNEGRKRGRTHVSEVNPDGRTESRYGIDGDDGRIQVGGRSIEMKEGWCSGRRKPRMDQVFVVAL